MNLFGTHSDCTRCHRKYHHDLMMVTKNSFDHLCIRCFNVKEKEKEYEKEKTNTLQSNDYSKDQKVA
jgi:hypothetical protein